MGRWEAWVRGQDGFGDPGPAAVLVPALLALVVFAIAAGRVGAATTALDSAAFSAARAASITRSAGQAEAAARASAEAILASLGITCAPSQVAIDASGFTAPVGEPAQVLVTVSCEVPLGELAVPGAPGTKRLSASALSAIDSYRERAG